LIVFWIKKGGAGTCGLASQARNGGVPPQCRAPHGSPRPLTPQETQKGTQNHMRNFDNVKKVVIKVGTSTLTFDNGSLNFRRIEELARAISDIKNSGRNVILVSSGAIGVGVSTIRLDARPKEIPAKQALAAVGQCQLMRIYGKLFGEYNQIVGQVLITKDVVDNNKMYQNAVNTFSRLLEYGVIPIVNENDTISTDEIEFGDNDTLSAYVAKITGSDLLIILTDIDGLYDKNPNEDGAKFVEEVTEITDEIKQSAGSAGSDRGVGGMKTKIMAAEIAAEAGIKTIIMSGENPKKIYDALGGENIGTFFNV